jgi:uncharacterized protein (DUF362 family)
MSTVVLERLTKYDYLPECSSLAKEYGTQAWDDRPEVAAIRMAVFAAMDTLDDETGIGARFDGRKVLVKPNLVTVYDHFGTMAPVSPETTDPRVLDALVLWLSRKAKEIVIVESSGRGNPTRASFRISGIDRLARHRGCGLLALEETPVDRYYLPQAGVQREILVPRIFSEVVRGEAAYVSVPKLKTNLYTGVTLGFKNAMGVIPYNLRQRHHHYAIDRKLVEMLYLFKPDLVFIDGVVGGEGECPAPVDPVDSRVVIAGDHAVETDRVATRLMGFDPSSIELMRVADELGFGDRKSVKVIGDTTPVPFRPADQSLLSDRVRKAFPGLKIFVGIDRVPPPADANGRELARAVEHACWGGCSATTRFALALIEAEGYRPKTEGVIIIGPGLKGQPGATGEGPFWYDADGKAWDEASMFALPGSKLVIGSCGRAIGIKADLFVEGCMPFANAPHMAIHTITKTSCRVLSFKNKNFVSILMNTVAQRAARRKLIKAGTRLDIPFEISAEPPVPAGPDGAGTSPAWVPWPLPPIGRAEKAKLLAFEDDAAAASLRGVFEERIVAKLFWKSQEWTTNIITWAPLALAALGALGLGVGWQPSTWFRIWLGIEAMHAAELPFSLPAMAKFGKRTGKARPAWQTVLLTLELGYPSWVPWALGIHG